MPGGAGRWWGPGVPVTAPLCLDQHRAEHGQQQLAVT